MAVVDFDPVRIGEAECAAWAAYYRRDWWGVLRGAVVLVREGFALGPVADLRGAWYVLRANQAWAPAENDPEAARRLMTRFYTLAARAGRIAVEPGRAAELEVEWWRVHRQNQHGSAGQGAGQGAGQSRAALVRALVDLYAYLYDTAPDRVRPAAEHRVAAMDHSDAWVAAGCRPDDPLLAAERDELVASYTALRRLTRLD